MFKKPCPWCGKPILFGTLGQVPEVAGSACPNCKKPIYLHFTDLWPLALLLPGMPFLFGSDALSALPLWVQVTGAAIGLSGILLSVKNSEYRRRS